MGLTVAGVVIGLAATVLMDIWALLLHRVAAIAPPNWGPVGRWVVHLARGQVFHDDIGAVAAVKGETGIGWIFHYLVGAIYGVVFLWIMGSGWLAQPTFPAAWVFSILTISAGWFLLQPGLGLGWAASRTPNPWKARGLGLAAHTVFGVGLWGAAVLI